MKIKQTRWTADAGWVPDPPGWPEARTQLVLVFGSGEVLQDGEGLCRIVAASPGAEVVGCSTAGEICGTQVTDHSLVVTAIAFEHTRIRSVRLALADCPSSFEAGRRLAGSLAGDKLVHVLVFCDGLEVNGSELARGLTADQLPGVLVTGGLAGDGERFRETFVISGDQARSREVVAVGLYGDRLRIGCGSLGGWDPFGPERLITRSRGNVLYELDGRSALSLYKRYLGEYAAGLPASALLFPLSLRSEANGPPVVRTVLAINEAEESMTFAGDLPEGQYARLMKANSERLIDGATDAARTSATTLGAPAELALLISCVGRKMVLKQRIEEEVESVREILGEDTVLAGFYSYGEIAPFSPTASCELHNQTMTITTLSEGP
jgi:hypothetical protein